MTMVKAGEIGAPRAVRIQRRGGVLKGCLIAVVVLVLLLAAAGVFAWTQRHKMFAAGAGVLADAMVTQMPVSDAERGEVRAVMDGVIAEIRAGTLTGPEFEKIMAQIETSPLIPTMGAAMFSAQYVDGSSLPDEEKAMARNELNRVGRGLSTKALNQADLVAVTKPIQSTQAGGEGIEIDLGSGPIYLKQVGNVTADDLRAMAALAKEKADAAGVEATPTPIDPSDELTRVLTEALGRVPGQAAGTTP